jgi:hypothetical protein
MTAAVRPSQCSTRLYVGDVRVLRFLFLLFARCSYKKENEIQPAAFAERLQKKEQKMQAQKNKLSVQSS